MLEIRLAGITPESVVDGIGLRYVVWAQGCKHRCKGCHSPHTWDFNGGQNKRIDDILDDIKKNRLLQGVTFSGGDPFEQAEKFAYLAGKVKELGLDVWCYTGYTFEDILRDSSHEGWKKLLNTIDVLVDGPFIEEQKDLKLAFRGSKNQRIIDIPKSLKEDKVILLDCNGVSL